MLKQRLCLKEIKLNGLRFTWSNEQNNLTLTRIDRLVCTPGWEGAHLSSLLPPSVAIPHVRFNI
ncbi:hypothetical protein Zm00014a_036202 [Zea mays]|uniref:Uncharacterized protein n=1 Tax=Zea mays TaxID=4577 RepID=A0A3L6DVX6_MAIZE|nr:hypothetical protein Zm00014a_036202 [Zea mays]